MKVPSPFFLTDRVQLQLFKQLKPNFSYISHESTGLSLGRSVIAAIYALTHVNANDATVLKIAKELIDLLQYTPPTPIETAEFTDCPLFCLDTDLQLNVLWMVYNLTKLNERTKKQVDLGELGNTIVEKIMKKDLEYECTLADSARFGF
jgi:hypothetical protein